MKTPILLLALALFAALAALPALTALRRRRTLATHGQVFCNAGFNGTRRNSLTLPAAAVTVGQNRLLKLTDSGTTYTLCGASEKAVAWTPDHATAVGDEVAGRLLGLDTETALGIASGAITANGELVSGANGTVKMLPSASGTHWVIGNSINAADDAAEFEYIPTAPRRVIIA